MICGIIVCLAGFLTVGGNLATAKSVRSPPFKSSTSQEIFIKDLLAWRDTSADPCDDFYRYSCGGKINENDPQNPFQGLLVGQQIDTYLRIEEILTKFSGPNSPPFGKAVQLYKSCLDQDPQSNFKMLVKLVADQGGWPLAEGSKWKEPGQTLTSILPTMAKIARSRLNQGIINAVVDPDPFDTSKYVVQVFQPPGLMIQYAPLLNQKLQIARSLVAYAGLMAGDQQPDLDQAMNMVELNNLLWQSLEPNPPKIKDGITRTTMGEFYSLTNIDIVTYLDALFEGIAITFSSDDVLVVHNLPYFLRLAQVLPQVNTRTMVDFEMLAEVLPAMGESGILSVAMHGRSDLMPIPPAPTRLPRPKESGPKHIIDPEWLNTHARKAGRNMNWFTCIQRASTWFSFAISKEYVEKYFTKTERARAKEATNEIINVFNSRLDKIDWMDENALKESKSKIANIKETYVYSDWVDDDDLLEKFYSSYDVSPIYLSNFWTANTFIKRTNFMLLSKSNLPLNVSITFDIGPLDVNAYYQPQENSINILAAIIQPPTFDNDRIELFNFAMLGAIIGHEITHGFDNMGQQFDERGNLRDWMSPEIHDLFMSKAKCYVKQYDQYKLTSDDFPLPGFIFQINGTVTLGENIADNGGLQQAYWAYKEWVKKHGEEKWPSSLSDFTPEQAFFMSYGHLWCTKYQGTQQELNVLTVDVHTPPKFRIIGTLSNFDEFSKAFGCSVKSNMNRGDESCHLW